MLYPQRCGGGVPAQGNSTTGWVRHIFGHFNLLRNQKVRFPARAIEDTLLYFIPLDVFQKLAKKTTTLPISSNWNDRAWKPREHKRKPTTMVVTRIRKLVTAIYRSWWKSPQRCNKRRSRSVSRRPRGIGAQEGSIIPC